MSSLDEQFEQVIFFCSARIGAFLILLSSKNFQLNSFENEKKYFVVKSHKKKSSNMNLV